MSQHLKHFLNFVGENKKLKELRSDDLVNYYKYRLEITNNNVKTSTVASEQITINAMVKWLYKKKEIDIVQLEFKRLPKTDIGNENVRRSTLTIEEYERLARAMRSYIARTTKPNKNLTEKELKFRKLVQHYILIASNSG